MLLRSWGRGILLHILWFTNFIIFVYKKNPILFGSKQLIKTVNNKATFLKQENEKRKVHILMYIFKQHNDLGGAITLKMLNKFILGDITTLMKNEEVYE